MAQYRWLVQVNAVAGKEEEFNKWYEEVHVPDLLRVPGIVKAERFRLAEMQPSPPGKGSGTVPTTETALEYRYLTIYTFETDDPAEIFREIKARAGTGAIRPSDTLEIGPTVCVVPI